jgi:hypothetical protein
MSRLAPPAAIDEAEGPVDHTRFHKEIRPACKPLVMRGLVRDWPAVAAAGEGDEPICRYLISCNPSRPVTALVAPPEEGGRYFYNSDITGFNFRTGRGSLGDFLADLIMAHTADGPPAFAVQSEIISELMPAFARANALDILPQVEPRIWIGNRIRVAPHFDLMENVACNVAGERRFTLFPPEQIGNLYTGPLELTPAGAPVSMVDIADPDLEAFPRFTEAWEHAVQATLEPGDALYIPFAWWHGVESLAPVSILVNYWWAETVEGTGAPWDALLHALLAYRHLPEDQRKVWRGLLGHYVFAESDDPVAHLPGAAKGVLGPPDPQKFAAMRDMLKQAIQRL